MLVYESSPIQHVIFHVQYSHNARLVFVCWRSGQVTCHLACDATPIGSYDQGHQGAVRSLDVSHDSRSLASCGADCRLVVWESESGAVVQALVEESILDSPSFSYDANLLLYSMQRKFNLLSVFDLVRDLRCDLAAAPSFKIPIDNCSKAVTRWRDAHTFLTGTSDGDVLLHDMRNVSRPLLVQKLHNGEITSLASNLQRTKFVSSSKDKHCHLFSVDETLSQLALFRTMPFGDNANCCSLHPNEKYVMVTGGQEAISVTQTSHDAGNFFTKFFFVPTNFQFGLVKSHFGTPLTCAFSPNGTSFASGGIDGRLLIHHLYDFAQEHDTNAQQPQDNFFTYEQNLKRVIDQRIHSNK